MTRGSVASVANSTIGHSAFFVIFSGSGGVRKVDSIRRRVLAFSVILLSEISVFV